MSDPSPFCRRLVQICKAERDRFGNGAKKEWMDPQYLRVGDYWACLAAHPEHAGWAGYDGRSHVTMDKTGTPKAGGNQNRAWSAAFISFVMHEAGAAGHFRFGPTHSGYTVDAIQEAANPARAAKFVARRHRRYAPKIGDLIVCERHDTARPDFDTYESYVEKGKFHAHGDIVTDIGKSHLTTIGGNVSDSVKEKRWWVNAKGMIGNSDPQDARNGVICVIETLL